MVVKIFLNDAIDDTRSFGVDPSFSMRSIDTNHKELANGQGAAQKPIVARMVSKPPRPDLKEQAAHPADDIILGPVLGKFVGTFG